MYKYKAITYDEKIKFYSIFINVANNFYELHNKITYTIIFYLITFYYPPYKICIFFFFKFSDAQVF